MRDLFLHDWKTKGTTLLFLLFSIWWVYLRLTVTLDNDIRNQLFAAFYGLIALWGGVLGVYIASKWGGWNSIMGRSILMFALGLLAQEFGQLTYSYYIYVLHIEIPYPSLGDFGYFGSIPFYIYGIILLSKASGTAIKLRSFTHQFIAIVLPLLMLLVAYTLFLQNYEIDTTNVLKIFLDFGYPFGQAIYISFAILTYLLSKGVLGGVMKKRILFILFALFIQFLADYTFLYQSSRGIWVAGGINDYMYLCAYSLMALSLMSLGTVYNKLREAK
jgi:hypothetical protein